MSIYKKNKLLFVSLLLSMVYLKGELIVVKQNKQGFFLPLDSSDKLSQKAITDTLLAYSWPTVIANSSLTSEESAELFSNKPYSEEQFLNKKLKLINTAYRALFIPTALYELFAISHYSSSTSNALKTANDLLCRGNINLSKNLNKINKKVHEIKKENYALYKSSSATFYDEAFFIINKELATSLFSFYKAAKKIKDLTILSEKIKIIAPKFAAFLIKNKNTSGIDLRESLLPATDTLNNNSILARALSLEYEARENNKTVLFRGSSAIEIEIRKNKKRVTLLGSSIKEGSLFGTILENYRSKNNTPYSISFGNSLFAGFFNDKGACAYEFLNSRGGYGLAISKKDQIEHESSNLLFIAPLGTLAGLFEQGEYFHSRSKAAVKKIGNSSSPIAGIAGSSLIDPCGIVTTVRDPLTHASLFSDFLAQNLKLIEKPEYSAQNQSKKIEDQLRSSKESLAKKSQKEASYYFKLFPTLKKYILKLTPHRLIEKNPAT